MPKPTMHLHAYLTFSGNCRNAMEFYQHCIGGELSLQTIGESPLAEKMPPEMRSCILHATLTHDSLVLMGTDMVGEKGRTAGNSISLVLHCGSQADLERIYRQLSEGGEQTHPLEQTFWGATLGNLTDRYGNQWLLHYKEN